MASLSLKNLGAKFSESHSKTLRKSAVVIFKQQFKTFNSKKFTLPVFNVLFLKRMDLIDEGDPGGSILVSDQ